MKDGIPEPKTCTIRFFKTDATGKQSVCVAEKEINLSMHFGDQFAEQTYDLDKQGSEDTMNVQSFKIKATFTCAKAKEADTNLLQTCIEWRLQQGPPSESARPVAPRRQTEKRPAQTVTPSAM